MAKNRRLLAALLALVMLFAVLYVVMEADHDCSGEHCAVCAQIATVSRLLRELCGAALLAGALAAAAVSAAGAALPAGRRAKVCTLISLKVKLSN